MKIGYLMQTGTANLLARPLSGPSHHVIQVCQALAALGHEVQLLMNIDGQLWHTSDLQHYAPVQVEWMARSEVRLLHRMVGRAQTTLRLPYTAFFEAAHFAQACRQFLGDCELFYERMGWMGYGGTLAARGLGIPLVLEVNGDHWRELELLGVAPQGSQKWVAHCLMQWMTEQAHHVVTTGEGWRTCFLERWPVEPAKVSTVENGSELVTLLCRAQLRAFAEPRLMPTINLVYVGGFEVWHGLRVLLRAVASARQQGAPVALTLLGAGPEQATIERQIQELQLQQVVTLTGLVDMPTLGAYLAQADIGLCPYCGRVEYSGLKLLDYKAAGLATIASGANGQPAVLRHGATGLIVPPCDEEQLGQAIVDLSFNHERRRAMGRLARLQAEEQHSWRHTAQQLDTIFQRVIRTGSKKKL